MKAEALEHQARDLPAALAAYRSLERSGDPRVRAVALARSARVLGKMRRPNEALDAYRALADVAGAVDGLPAGLVASYGRCLVVRDAGRPEDLQREAFDFAGRLSDGRWPLARAEYTFYAAEARRWLPPGSDAVDGAVRVREALSDGIDGVWRDWGASGQATPRDHGRRALWAGDVPLLLAWRVTPDRAIALVAGPSYVRRRLLAGADAVLERQRARILLTDSEGRPVEGVPEAAGALQARRAASDTRLPWTLTVGDADPGAALAEAASRRRLMFAGLMALGVFVAAGSAFILRAVNREAEVARLQTDFVAAVSHEFRTPLASMRQLSELLADGRVASDARRADYYRTLQRESERLHRLVEALLDFGRMDSGAREYALSPVDVNAMASDVAAEFGAGVRDRGYTVEAAYATGVGQVAADREALSRAIWNLLDNAVKYSPACKTVWVETAQENGRVLIRVRDSGVGIAPGERDAIFDKFRRGTGAAATRAKGTGLGLAMVRHIVSAHGGRITVQSTPGEGSTFTLDLPQAHG